MESVQVLQPGDSGEYGGLCPGGVVYNLEVAVHHNYFAEGILVHNCYKNLYAAPAVFGETPKFMGAGAESNRAMDFHHKMRHVRSMTGGRGTYVLTATPTKNSPLEIYNMLTLVTDHLEANGVPGVDDFINRYCDIQGIIVPTKDGSVSSSPAVVGFQNLGELRDVMGRYMVREDAQTAVTKDGIGLKLPERVDFEQYFEMHPAVWDTYQHLRQAARNAKIQDNGEDHLFAIMAKMRKLTLDPALFSPSFAGLPNPRFQKAAELAQNALKEGGKAVVFMDLGQASQEDEDGNEGDAYDRLVDHFVAAGIPRDQIAVVTAQRVKKATDRQKIEQAYNDGKIKIVIGNTPTIGEGFNLQNGTTDMIHMDTPWDPGTYWQRLGRGVRQGNPVDQVRNHVLLGKGSFDSLTYTTMLGKKGWQQQVWDSSIDHAENATGLDLEDIALALSDDPEETRKQIKEAKEKLNQGAAKAALRNAMSTYADYLDLRTAWLKRAREAQGRKDGPTDNDRRVLAQREHELKALRDHLKNNEHFAPYAKLLDYAGPVIVSPQAVPLHQGMHLTVLQQGQPKGIRVNRVDDDGTIWVTGPGLSGNIKVSALPSIVSWEPAEEKYYYYDGAHERPSFAKAVLVTRRPGVGRKTVLLVKRGAQHA
ncbi:helicase-related protein [Deinococcus cellulosilyticus]|uniref:helicase-related protein n=1 Tax=Deinococcus cellulosilyticus TaxID=401558 RepID=UPI003530C4C8